jgi:hypothetical protein
MTKTMSSGELLYITSTLVAVFVIEKIFSICFTVLNDTLFNIASLEDFLLHCKSDGVGPGTKRYLTHVS